MPRANTTSTSGHGSAETIGTCALSSPGVVTAAAVPATTASRRAHLMTSILQPNLRKPDLDASWRSGGFSSSDGKALAGDSESDNVTRRHCVAGFTAAATAPDRGYSSTLATWTPLRVRRRRCEVLPVGRRFRNPPRGLGGGGLCCRSFPGRRLGFTSRAFYAFRGASTASSSSCAASSVFSASSAASGSASSPLAVFLRRRRRCLGFFGLSGFGGGGGSSATNDR